MRTPAPTREGISSTAVVLALAVVFMVLILWRRWYRIGRPCVRPVLTPLGGLGLFLAMIVLGQTGLAGVAVLLEIDASAPARLALREQSLLSIGRYAAEAIALAVFVVAILVAPRSEPDLRTGPMRTLGLGVAALGMAWPITIAAGLAVIYVWGTVPEAIAHETLRMLAAAGRDVWLVVMVLLAVLVAPVMEEVMYRGLLQQVFRGLGMRPWVAVAVTSALFAFMHLGTAAPHALASLFVLSLAFGWAYERTGRLAAPIVMHVLFNAGNVAMALGGS